MYWQNEVLRKSAVFTTGGTFRLDLPDNGLLGGISLQISGTPVNDSMIATEKWRLLDFISAIEVIADGSTVLKSVTGQVAKYLAWLDGGGCIPDQYHNYGTSTKRVRTVVNFGRRFRDPGMGLDLSRYNSVELQLTNDGSATYFTGNLAVDVIGHFLRDAPGGTFPGFMRTEEWRKWTTVADEKKYLELPTRDKLRRIILQVIPDVGSSMESETQGYNVADVIELYLKTGLLKVFDSSLRELWYDNLWEDGRDVLQALHSYHTDEYGIHMGLGQTLGIAGARLMQSHSQSTYGTSIWPGEDNATQRRLSNSEADEDAIIAVGLSLENCSFFRFDQSPDPTSWLDTEAMKTVQLNIHTADSASAADGTIRVVLDRYAAY